MSVRCLAWAWSQTVGEPRAKGLLAAIADEAHDHGITWVGNEYLIAKTELKRATFFELMAKLEEQGLIIRLQRRRKRGTRASNFLVVPVDLDAAYRQFERMVRDEEIAANPMADTVRDPDLAEVRVPDSPGPGPGLTGSGSRTDQVQQPDSDSPGPGLAPPRVTEPSVEPLVDPSEDPLPAERSRPDVDQVCQRLSDLMAERDPVGRVDPLTTAWQTDARLLLDVDGRTLPQVLAVIEWCQADDFNRRIVRSVGALRKRFGELADRAGVALTGLSLIESQGQCSMDRGAAPTPAEGEWAALVPKVREALGGPTFDIWIAPAHAHAGPDGELLLAVPKELFAWVSDRFNALLDRLAGRHVDVVICQEATP